MRSPKCAITTCPRAASKLELTIARLREVGFRSVDVHQDALRVLGPWGNFLRAAASGAEYVFQDDIFLSKAIIQYVDAAVAEAAKPPDIMSLYCSRLNDAGGFGWHPVNGCRAWGALGYWLSPRFREGLKTEFSDKTMGNGTELRLEEFLRRSGDRFLHWQHSPSLILHTGVVSISSSWPLFTILATAS